MRNKKGDDLKDVIREETTRGRRPLDTDATRLQAERTAAVLRIFRDGTREDLRALLKAWGYSKEEIEKVLNEYDAALGQQSS
jgi:SOS response regulatory protein OraA/RecX